MNSLGRYSFYTTVNISLEKFSGLISEYERGLRKDFVKGYMYKREQTKHGLDRKLDRVLSASNLFSPFLLSKARRQPLF